jgi:hypothetical protein
MRSWWRVAERLVHDDPAARADKPCDRAESQRGVSGPVRDAVEATMNWWMQQLEDLISAGITLGQLAPYEPAQLAFEIQALLGAGSHQYRLRRDPQAVARAGTAVRQRLESVRAPRFPALA